MTITDPALAPTPPWTVRALLRRLQQTSVLSTAASQSLAILDPCAGLGGILAVLGEELPNADVRSVELDPARARIATNLARKHGNAPTHVADFFELYKDWSGDWWPDLVVAHPPPAEVFNFARTAFDLVTPQVGTVCVLARLDFLRPIRRSREWLRLHTPDVWLLPRRVERLGSHGLAATAAWFCWGPTRAGFTWMLDRDERDERNTR